MFYLERLLLIQVVKVRIVISPELNVFGEDYIDDLHENFKIVIVLWKQLVRLFVEVWINDPSSNRAYTLPRSDPFQTVMEH